MASETRSLRPFEAMHKTQAELRELVQLTAHDPQNRSARVTQKLALSEDDYLNSDIDLWLGRATGENPRFVETVLDEIEMLYPNHKGAVELVITANNKRLKMTDVVYRQPVKSKKDLPMKIGLRSAGPGGTRPRALQTPGDGCEIVVEFLLGSDIDRTQLLTGRAWRKGSWLARVSVGVTASAELTGPQVLPLTEVVRKIFEVPENTLHFCRILGRGPQLLTATRFDEILEFYVDQAVYESVLDAPSADWSQRLQLGWILDVIKTYLLVALQEESFQDFDPSADEWSGSIMRAILEKVAGSPRADHVADALETLRDQPWLFLAQLEDCADLAALEQALTGSIEGATE
jgi:hypothetical protein